jgi:dihydropyrimidinase
MPNTSHVDTIVRGGQVVTATEVFDAAIAISGEKIAAIGPEHLLPKADKYIDAAGKYVLPGLIDCHVHLDRCDSYQLGSIAAAHSGLTTIIPFGTYNIDKQETIPQAAHRLREEINATSVVDVGFHFIVAHTPYALKGIPEAMKMGVTSYKMFMTYKKNAHRMCPDDYLCEAMELVSKGGGLVQLHCESGNIIDFLENKLLGSGCVHPTCFPEACPDWAEEEAINRAIKMAAVTNCPIYVVHLSSHVGLERIKQAQAAGQRVWTETCPQYLLLSDEQMAKVGPLAKIGPPLRPKDGPDQPALWKGLEMGYISAIGSDHAPNFPEVKKPGWDNIWTGPDGIPIPFGAPGVETVAPLAFSEGVSKRNLPPTWMARVMSENPARIFGLYPKKGAIRVGSDADLTIIDPNDNFTVRATEHHGNSKYTLFEGWPVQGKAWMTLLRGKVLLNQGKLEQKPGYGKFVPAGGPMPPLGGPAR